MEENIPKPVEGAKRREKEEAHVLSPFFYDHSIRKWFILAREKPGNIIDDSINDVRFSPGIDTPEGTLKQLLHFAQRFFGHLFERREEEFTKLLQELGSKKFQNEEEMLSTVIKSIYGFATDPANEFTREELEKNYQENRKNKILINEILDCDTYINDPHNLRIHLIGTSSLTSQKVRDGLKILAHKIETSSKGSALDQVKTLTMRSWITYERPEIFEKLGFNLVPLSEQDRRIGHAIVKITREKFIEKYGSNKGS